jgi:hypothetical protein
VQQVRVVLRALALMQLARGVSAPRVAKMKSCWKSSNSPTALNDLSFAWTRKTDVLGARVGGESWDRFTVHYTPTHGSWLNQAEVEIGIFSRQCLCTRRLSDPKTLRHDPEPGTAAGIATAPKSTGSSTAKPLVASSATKRNVLTGRRPGYI